MSEHELPYGPAAQRLFEALLDREEFSESDYRIVATALERREVGVRGEVAARAGGLEKIAKNRPMLLARTDEDHLRLREP